MIAPPPHPQHGPLHPRPLHGNLKTADPVPAQNWLQPFWLLRCENRGVDHLGDLCGCMAGRQRHCWSSLHRVLAAISHHTSSQKEALSGQWVMLESHCSSRGWKPWFSSHLAVTSNHTGLAGTWQGEQTMGFAVGEAGLTSPT